MRKWISKAKNRSYCEYALGPVLVVFKLSAEGQVVERRLKLVLKHMLEEP